VVRFGSDLRQNLDGADAAYQKINDSIDKYIAAQGIAAPPQAPYSPPWQPPADAPDRLDLVGRKVAAVVWCIGFRTDFSWIEADIFDQRGYPRHERGVTAARGLYFLGLPWQYTWGSGRFSGVARDAAYLAQRIAAVAREHRNQARDAAMLVS
jgi:putative flavoprotein involved in K+ transport